MTENSKKNSKDVKCDSGAKAVLSQRIEKLLILKKHRQESTIIDSDLYQFCIICKMCRVDNDITGLTCGRKSCLSSLAGKFKEIEDKLRSIITENLGFKLPEEKSVDLSKLCEIVKKEIEKIEEATKQAEQRSF